MWWHSELNRRLGHPTPHRSARSSPDCSAVDPAACSCTWGGSGCLGSWENRMEFQLAANQRMEDLFWSVALPLK